MFNLNEKTIKKFKEFVINNKIFKVPEDDFYKCEIIDNNIILTCFKESFYHTITFYSDTKMMSYQIDTRRINDCQNKIVYKDNNEEIFFKMSIKTNLTSIKQFFEVSKYMIEFSHSIYLSSIENLQNDDMLKSVDI